MDGSSLPVTPLVTVLIDTYNYGHFIEAAIDSAIAQDFALDRAEILVVDDGSTDDTAERVAKYGARIKYFKKSNGGQASAFNFGIAQARGEIVALLDADDVWLPGKLTRICEAFAANAKAGLVFHRFYRWDAAGTLAEDQDFVAVNGNVMEDARELLRYPMMPTSCIAFRRETLEKLLPIPATLRSQADAYLTALAIFIAAVAAIPEFLTKYRVHGANLFQSDGRPADPQRLSHRMEMRTELLQGINVWLKAHGFDSENAKLRAYLMQWKKSQERDGFALRAPGNLEYFRHLLEYPRVYGSIMTRRHRAYSYVQAFAALVLGYDHLHVLDDVRTRRKRWMKRGPVGAIGAEL